MSSDEQNEFFQRNASVMFAGLVSKREDAVAVPVAASRVSPQAVQTNGIGKRTTAHLNLTRSLADTDIDDEPMQRARERVAERRAYLKAHGMSRHDSRTKIPYAGSELHAE